MAAYQVWMLDGSYNKVAYLHRWQRLRYRIGLNQLCEATVDLPADDPKIADLALMQRLLIRRDGALIWSGLLEGESFGISEQAPQGDVYALDARDLTAYLLWRTIERPSGADYDQRSGPADDVAKAYVYYHAGAGAATARQFSDLTVQGNASAAGTVTKLWVGGTLLEHLQRLAAEKSFWWRMVPGATGVEFRTAYPLWGVDRTRGNGANEELVMTLDRRNVLALSYRKDLLDHCNHFYMGGAGEGRDQLMVEQADSAAVAAYGRREMWVPATQYVTAAGLQAEGDRRIKEYRPYEAMSVAPKPGAIAPANLGDQVTILERRYGRTFEFDGVITAIAFTVTPDGVERVEPEVTAV